MIDGKVIVIGDVTLDDLEKLITEMKSNSGHVSVQGNGLFVFDGHSVTGTASLSAGDLTVTVTSKPFWMPMSGIEYGLESALGKGRQMSLGMSDGKEDKKE